MARGATVTRMPPAPHGKPFYVPGEGWKIRTGRGGKVVPFTAPQHGSGSSGFSAKTALRRAGIASVSRADAAARRAPGSARRAVRRADAIPNLGGSPLGVGGLIVYVFASIVALALLENLLSGRGPGAVSKILNAFGAGISKLVNPADPIVGQGSLPASSSTASPAGSRATGPVYKSAPTKVDGVSFTGAPLTGVRIGLVQGVAAVAKAAGATVVQVISGRRSPASNTAAGGVSDSNHLTGDAIDARAYVPGKGWVPLGTLPGFAAVGLRSGNQPGFFRGRPDPNHVDTGANQG